MESTDQVLLARIAGGDRGAFAALYDRYAARTYGLVLKLMRNAREAEDVLQETFWHVWTKAEQFDARRGTPLAWLILIARSRCLDHLRRSSRNRVLERDFEESMALDDIAADVQRSENAQRTAKALASLPEEQRKAIQLAFFGGLTHQEIAERENIALGTIKTRIRLGMNKLRELLAELDDAYVRN